MRTGGGLVESPMNFKTNENEGGGRDPRMNFLKLMMTVEAVKTLQFFS